MDDQDVDRFDRRSHEYRLNQLQLRYMFATGIVIALGLSQIECNHHRTLSREFERGEVSGERECLRRVADVQAAKDLMPHQADPGE